MRSQPNLKFHFNSAQPNLKFNFNWVTAQSKISFQLGTAQSKIQFQLGHSSNYNLTRSMLEFQVQHLMSQPNCMINVRLLSCQNQNGRQSQAKWKKISTKMEDDLTQNGRRPHPKWKT